MMTRPGSIDRHAVVQGLGGQIRPRGGPVIDQAPLVVTRRRLPVTGSSSTSPRSSRVEKNSTSRFSISPVAALLGETIDEASYRHHLGDFYQYIDLTNQQILHRREGRISGRTWENWSEGILWILRRPAFERAWLEVRDRSPESFDGVYEILRGETGADPLKWERSA